MLVDIRKGNNTMKKANKTNGLTAAQKKLPAALQAAILKKKKTTNKKGSKK